MNLRFAILGVLAALIALIALPGAGCGGAAFTADGSAGGSGGTTTTTTTTGTGGASCPGTTTPCAGGCFDTQTSATNCGSCGKVCDQGASCVSGKCQCSGSRTDCPMVGCVDLTSDAQNCGKCGTNCGSTSCAAGKCGTSCTGTGMATCGSSCVNLTNDTKNCGACGKACASGASCVNSVCVCGTSGQIICGSACVDPTTNAANCGGCGKPCPSNQECSSSTCGCPKSTTMCGSTCVDTIMDPDNCDGCGNACNPGEECVNKTCMCNAGLSCSATGYTPALCTTTPGNSPDACGGCASSDGGYANVCANAQACAKGVCVCRPGFSTCGSGCVMLENDPNNCSGCGITCTQGQLCIPGTPGGVCMPAMSCPPSFTLCTSTSNNIGTCANLKTDPGHCGVCSTTCAPGELCVQGMCEAYFTAPCTGCPCAACGSAHTCCPSTMTTPTYCVAGGHCAG